MSSVLNFFRSNRWSSGKKKHPKRASNRRALGGYYRRLSAEPLEDRRLLAVLSIGSGDGSLSVTVDGYGAFGRAVGGDANDAVIDPLNGSSVGLIYESGLAIGSSSGRQVLTSGAVGSSGGLSSVSVSVAGGTVGTSSFTLSGLTGSLAVLNGLDVDLSQELEPLFDATGTVQIGAVLTQTYVLENGTGSSVSFDLVRYNDVDVQDTGSADGGGRVLVGPTEILVTTGTETDIENPDVFVAITAEGGTTPGSNRFEVDAYNGLLEGPVISGSSLDDDVQNDGVDADELIDSGLQYDATLALRNTFSLNVSQSATYTTRTVFGDGDEDGSVLSVLDRYFSPPQVTNVKLSHEGSATTHAPYEFDDVVGDGEQLRTVPVGSVDRVYVQFTDAVTLTDSDLELIALNRVLNEPTPTLIQSPANGNDYTAVWELSSPLLASQYLIRLSDSIVGTNNGLALDGEWTNPASVTTTTATSVFPSGNDVAGGDFEFVFTILPGDANRDNLVNVGDNGILGTYYGTTPGRTWAQADFTGDGFTNLSDLAVLGTYYNTNWQNLVILGDYDNDFDVDATDFTTFDGYYDTSNPLADLNGDSSVDIGDLGSFAHRYGIALSVLT